jgi:hypothetical protein
MNRIGEKMNFKLILHIGLVIFYAIELLHDLIKLRG